MQISIGVIICVGIVFVLTLAVTVSVAALRAYDYGFSQGRFAGMSESVHTDIRPPIAVQNPVVRTYHARIASLYDKDVEDKLLAKSLALEVVRDDAVALRRSLDGWLYADMTVIVPADGGKV